ncbi:ABC transporter permease [Enterococcus sp. BWM-S5]|uniref:ABC transporter permease n=1 Tax=Enterococcus larvae TaxID=2794352 RepID=A0ABS4CG18_9ENTE|nr:ABC transporter permease [Enterococcus larvae]MBP1045158.1 ABC transporter permease [Enterococcus larvae]
MFTHLYIYRLKVLLKDKPLMFWTFMFPVCMGIFFTAAFSGLDDRTYFDQVPVGIVQEGNNAHSETFIETMNALESDGTKMLKPVTLTKEQAAKQLDDGDIYGYYVLSDSDISLNLNQQGIQQSLLSTFLDQFQQAQKTVAALQQEAPELLATELAASIGKQQNFIQVANKTASKGSTKSFFFFTLVGMSCMFGFFWGLSNTNDEQANQSANGIRLSMAPQNKISIVLANLAAAFTVFVTELYIILAIFRFVYQVDFGTRWNWILLTCTISALTAISMGMCIGNLLKVPLDQKISLGVTFQIVCSFLAGMMVPDVKYLISKYVPILGQINPVNLVSESLYKLYYYENIDSFYINLICLLVLTIIFVLLSFVYERRAQYVSV